VFLSSYRNMILNQQRAYFLRTVFLTNTSYCILLVVVLIGPWVAFHYSYMKYIDWPHAREPCTEHNLNCVPFILWFLHFKSTYITLADLKTTGTLYFQHFHRLNLFWQLVVKNSWFPFCFQEYQCLENCEKWYKSLLISQFTWYFVAFSLFFYSFLGPRL